MEKDSACTEIGAVATKLPFPLTGGGITRPSIRKIEHHQGSPVRLDDLSEILVQLGLSDLRSMAREYEIATSGLGKQQLAEAILAKMKQPEAVRRVAATLQKQQRQLLAALTLAGGSMTEDDLSGLFQRFSLGQPSQMHGMLTALQKKALLFRMSLTSTIPPSKNSTLLDSGWYIPLEVRSALRVSMPITPFNEFTADQSRIKLSNPSDLLADLLLVASALNGYQLSAEDGWQETDMKPAMANSVPSNLPITDGSVALPPPPDMPSRPFLASLQKLTGRSPAFLRFAVRLLRLAAICSREEYAKGKPSLHILPDTTALLLGLHCSETLGNLFELWLTHSSYGELAELQEYGLYLRCRATSFHLPSLRPGELDAEHSETRQYIITLLAQAPVGQWISFSAFVRFIYRLNPFFLQRRSRLFPTPHWWIEQEQGHPLHPAQLNDWLQAEAHYLEHFVLGPLHWWGICDIVTSHGGDLLAFRLTSLAQQLLHGLEPSVEPCVPDSQNLAEIVTIRDATELLVACSFHAWQVIEIIEPFVEKIGILDGRLRYRFTPKAFSHALSRGHRPAALLELLRHYKSETLGPDSALSQLFAQLERWIASYGHVRLYTGVSLLETTDPIVMRELSATTALDDLIIKAIHPTLLVLKKGATEHLLDDLKRHGQFPLLHEEDPYESERS